MRDWHAHASNPLSMMPRGGPEYTEGTRCDRAFSVVQGAGKGCTIRQDRLVGFKDHGFNQKCAIAEAIENLPMDDIIE